MAIQRVTLGRLLTLLGVDLDHGAGSVDGRDMRFLRPVSKLELRLSRVLESATAREKRTTAWHAHVAHVEQFPRLGAGIVWLASVFDRPGSADGKEGRHEVVVCSLL
jgi:hypothetical protein